MTAAAAGAAVGADVAASGGTGEPAVRAKVFCFFDGERGSPDFSVATRLIPAFDVAMTAGLAISEAR